MNIKTKAMSYLFFDTETTGLPLRWNAPITDIANWPRLVQLAWIVYDTEKHKTFLNNVFQPFVNLMRSNSEIHNSDVNTFLIRNHLRLHHDVQLELAAHAHFCLEE